MSTPDYWRKFVHSIRLGPTCINTTVILRELFNSMVDYRVYLIENDNIDIIRANNFLQYRTLILLKLWYAGLNTFLFRPAELKRYATDFNQCIARLNLDQGQLLVIRGDNITPPKCTQWEFECLQKTASELADKQAWYRMTTQEAVTSVFDSVFDSLQVLKEGIKRPRIHQRGRCNVQRIARLVPSAVAYAHVPCFPCESC